MRILTRYLLADLLRMFLLTLTAMTLLLFVVLLGREAVDRGLGLGPLLEMAPYMLPEAMQFTLPGALLLATTGVYGRLAAGNEVVAIKSLGISPLTFVWPTLIVAVLISFAGVLLNDLAVSWGRLGQERVFWESMEAVAYGQLRNSGSFQIDRYSVVVRGVEGRKLIQPTVIRKDPGSDTPHIVTADTAEFRTYPDEQKLVVQLENAEHVSGEKQEMILRDFRLEISMEELLSRPGAARSPSNYALAEIGPAKAEEQERMQQIRQEMAARAAYAMLTGEFDDLGEEAWQPQERALEHAQRRLDRFNTEPYRRWANGFSCLAFALVGIPVAILLRKGEFLASFFICFLPILLFYYPLLMLSLSGAKKGTWPPATVWLSNLVLLLVGGWLMRRVMRY